MTALQPNSSGESEPDASQLSPWNDGLPPMDPRIQSIQPGGGFIIKLELLWGYFRRWYLKTFRRGYVERMRSLRLGEFNGCPHEVLDPRDIKFYRNQGGYEWKAEDDPFTWRNRLPFAREGLAELLILSILFFGAAAVLIAVLSLRNTPFDTIGIAGWLLTATSIVLGMLVVWFFRDPHRNIPAGDGVVVSAADGKVVAIDELECHPDLNGPAVSIGIFLSIFNVHINRAPMGAKVIALRYKEGKFLNALKAESATENEQLTIHLETLHSPHRHFIVKQITGAIARWIVCWLKPQDELKTGEKLGMIKLGSRTEMILPLEEGLTIHVALGDQVKAGSDIIAEYR